MPFNKSSPFPRGIKPRGKNPRKSTRAAEPRGIRKELDKRDFALLKDILQGELQPIRGDIQSIKADIVILSNNVEELRLDMRGLREQIQQLTVTLDNFVKMMTDYKEEFIILKAEVDQMKRVFKEKFGVEIAAQR